MSVSLIAKTQGVGDLAQFGLGELMAYAARVSNPGNQMNTETSAKLLTYCLRNGHWSVFETASITMKIETSRAISAQILRHRSFTFQEFSLRYAQATEMHLYEARSQDPKNRQNSVDNLPEETKEWFMQIQLRNNSQCQYSYESALERGIAKEQARFLLPMSTATTLYMTGSVRSWVHYCETRGKKGVQLEHKNIALDCLDILLGTIPELTPYFHSLGLIEGVVELEDLPYDPAKASTPL